MPEHEKSQKIYYEWLELSWKTLKSTLNWWQALSLIEVLCDFTYPDYNVENVFKKWEEIVSGAWEVKPGATSFERMVSSVYSGRVTVEQVASPRQINPLVSATRKMMKRLMGKEICPARKTHFLLAVNPRLKQFMQENYQNRYAVSIAPLFLLLATYGFEHISPIVLEDQKILQIALDDILNYLPFLAEIWSSDCIESTEAFIGYMPPIMAFCALQPELMNQTLQVIDFYMEISRIRNAPKDSLHSWTQLLVSLCSSVSFAPAAHRKKIAQAGMLVFARCTHPSLLKKKEKILVPDHKKLIGISSMVMGLKFLSLNKLECLDPNDWKGLFQGLTGPNLQEMLTDLEEEKTRFHINHIAIARIIRYATSLSPEVLLPYLNSLASKLNVLDPDALSLRIRYHYVHACTALLQKESSRQLDKLRDKLIKDFIQAFFKGINEENHLKFKKIFLRLLQEADLVVVEKIKKGYVIPPNALLSLRENLLEIKVDVEGRLQALKGIPRTRQLTEAVSISLGI